MIRVGLTGGIGSGKTTVARVLEQLGVPVYYADERGRWLSDNDPEVAAEIRSLFGETVYRDGRLDRSRVARQVFADSTLRERLNGIVHPAVRNDFHRWAAGHTDTPYIIMESAILFESGFDAQVDRAVVVTAPEALRIARAMRRDGTNEAAVRARIAAQMEENDRIARADHLLHADDRQLLIPQILRLHTTLLKVAKDSPSR